ncbi:type II secretion system protein [Candidatus Venteria ishoeyi]|uniref:type II secretion system protein n=1 Tax=Candidatus Venteria ishoeyi TaxID=1899563 RepID=UPI0025A56BF6|nr:type II secretion system protein [Candidatus Venteria ishoeyi]MDM8545135.1 type II secretion system protein [Candidatus Venteria ishoeyi]
MNKPGLKLQGFTLVELAIVLIIVSALLGTVLKPLSMQQDVRRVQATQSILEQAKTALIGFAMLNQRLPCPDMDNDGQEEYDPSDLTVCQANTEGYLPWATLGIISRDAWKNPMRYRADNNYTSNAWMTSITPTTATSDKLRIGLVNTSAPDLITTDANDDSQVLAIIFSCGKNAKPDQRNNDGGGLQCTNGTSPDATYAQDSPRYNESNPSSDFDDILVWLPKNIFIPQMVQAGVLQF